MTSVLEVIALVEKTLDISLPYEIWPRKDSDIIVSIVDVKKLYLINIRYMWASLVILAAGMGNRYGWLKQIEKFGPHGESLLEYAVYDALQAGFDHIVFIIREEFEDAFRSKFSVMLDACPRYDLIFQEMDPIFPSIQTVAREKPRWTLHATLSAADVVDQPFAVVNADDRYGNTSYDLIYRELMHIRSDEALIVWYILWNTLSHHGTVNRGVCEINTEKMTLRDVKERYAIGYTDDGSIIDKDKNDFSGKEIVSMNFRWFHPKFFDQVWPLFEVYVRAHADDPRAEMVIPDGVDVLVKQWNLTCRVLQSSDDRQWVTNPEDKPKVQDAFNNMIDAGVYPENLWE